MIDLLVVWVGASVLMAFGALKQSRAYYLI